MRIRIPAAALGLAVSVACSTAIAQDQTVPAGLPTVTGVDRGSTALLSETDEFRVLGTFDTYGSRDIGRVVGSLSASVPDAGVPGLQLDGVAVLAGPSGFDRPELLAGGLGARYALPGGRTTVFVRANHADVVLGAPQNRALDAAGTRQTVAAGARHAIPLDGKGEVSASLAFELREAEGEFAGSTVLDEGLRLLTGTVFYDYGTPFLAARQAGLTLTKGLSGLGASAEDNPQASLPGATTDFLKLALSGAAYVPVSPQVVLGGALVAQWTEDSLPLAARCGFATNAFSRAFDRSYVNGDRCLGLRHEVARNLPLPRLTEGRIMFAQAFAGGDYGLVSDVGNRLVDGGTDTWAGVHGGVRMATADGIGEVSLTHALDTPDGVLPQDETRAWVRVAYRF